MRNPARSPTPTHLLLLSIFIIQSPPSHVVYPRQEIRAIKLMILVDSDFRTADRCFRGAADSTESWRLLNRARPVASLSASLTLSTRFRSSSRRHTFTSLAPFLSLVSWHKKLSQWLCHVVGLCLSITVHLSSCFQKPRPFRPATHTSMCQL